MSLIIIVLFAVALSVGGFFMKRDSKKSDNPANKIFGSLFLFGGIAVLTIGLAHTFLHKSAWTDVNKQMFLFILIAVTVLYTLGISVLFGLRAKKENNKIGLITWCVISLVVLAGGVSSYSNVNHMNDGWTSEREAKFMNNCQPECPDCGSDNMESLDCNCQLKYTKEYFPNPNDYNQGQENEKYKQYLKDKCNVCSQKYVKENTGEPEGTDF